MEQIIMKAKNNKKAPILSKIVANYNDETQAILRDDPKYFKRILRKKSRLPEILKSLEQED